MIGALSLIVISTGALIIAFSFFNSLYNPVTLYVAPFAVCALLAATGLFGIYQPADTTLIIIALSIVGFSIGTVMSKDLFNKASSVDSSENGLTDFDSNSLNVDKILFILCSIATLISIFFLSKTIPQLLSGQGLEYVKFQYSNAEGATLFSTRELLLFQWVITPIYHVAFIVFSYHLSKLQLNLTALLFSVIGMAVIVLVSGGRNSVFVFLVICLMGVLCSEDRKSIWAIIRKLPSAFKIAVIVAVVVLVYITQERSLSDDSGVLENVFFYFAGAIRYLDYILAHPSIFSIGSEPFFGQCLFGFLVNPINLVCSILFGYDYQGTDSIISNAAALYIPFSKELSGNALCTCIYPFIRDFGFLGIFIGPILYGVLASFVWGRAFPKNANGLPVWKCIWIYFAYCLVFSEWRYTLIFPATGFVFFCLMIVFIVAQRAQVLVISKRGRKYIG